MSFNKLFSLPLTLLLAIEARAQSVTDTVSSIILSGSNVPPSSLPNFGGDLLPTGPEASYLSYTTTNIVNSSVANIATTFAEANGTLPSSASTRTRTTSSTSVSILQGTFGEASPTGSLNGTNSTFTNNSTASRTSSSSATPTNTQPCNNYPELCDRKYSNITFVAAHNSPFVNPNNAAANQYLGVTDQLNDGIRMLQGQTHYNSTTNTISYCHSSCDLLNAGTAEEFFRDVARWVRRHPYDVVTLLIGNADFIDVGNYTAPLEDSGLARYAYEPPQIPMNLTSWPTLGELILTQKRVIIFMDYKANQTTVPYILDEFSQIWETPFSPTNRTFPCTQQRPPDLDRGAAEQRMYMANHNLNTEISFGGTSLLVPTTALINETNAVEGYGSLGLMASDCTGELSST
ncbi:MAG: hypothetical protein Q9164_005701 [Protoblastenia rupestris]